MRHVVAALHWRLFASALVAEASHRRKRAAAVDAEHAPARRAAHRARWYRGCERVVRTSGQRHDVSPSVVELLPSEPFRPVVPDVVPPGPPVPPEARVVPKAGAGPVTVKRWMEPPRPPWPPWPPWYGTGSQVPP